MDTKCFKEHFLPLNKKLYLIAFRFTGNVNDAEDMVQEAYLKLWNKKDELDNIINSEAFAVSVLKNLCLDFLRSKHYTTSDLDSKTEYGFISEFSTESRVESADELKHVINIIEQFPQQQQTVIKLRHLMEYSLQEIEEQTGLSSINIRTILSRARKKIREQFVKI
jgi:RNA polymerase sigma factor, sigma-70 family